MSRNTENLKRNGSKGTGKQKKIIADSIVSKIAARINWKDGKRVQGANVVATEKRIRATRKTQGSPISRNEKICGDFHDGGCCKLQRQIRNYRLHFIEVIK